MDLLSAIAPDALDLAGAWDLRSADGQHAATYPVPGDIHSALVTAGIIDHPYRGRNELKARWVADSDWIASRQFQASKQDGARYHLDIDYLDTVAEIRLNGELVLTAENCFRRYRPDVTAALRDGDNQIEILFKSNTHAANLKQAAQPFPIPYTVSNSPIPNGNMLRKPGCHFGWDWNLAIAPIGLYGRIQLCRMQQFRIEHVVTHQKHLSDGSAVVDIDVVLYGRGTANVEVSFDGQRKTRRIDHAFGEAKQRFRFIVDHPELWWPAGHGTQHLYELHVDCDGQTETRAIGLRQVELITSPDDAGNRFAFRINGREVFCRGANWIPADALPSNATPELTRKLLQAAVDANMNMVRVWGGGYYEQNFFYELCDEMGLMVWQDFMFSCSLYPSTPEFLREVKAEVDYQVKRLQHHASIVLWCGDNELIGALTWFKEPKENRDRYLVNYDRLNRAIEETMRAADPNGIWWPSSPSPGILDFGDAWHNDGKGDMHFWSVWHEGRSFDHYRDVKPRFCSEFGFQSFPSLQLIRNFAESEEDLNISSPVMEHHQRNAGGNARIAETLFRYFRFPMDFGNFVYLSQIQHGLAMRTAVEHWRSLKPHCMGTLYWQLNDTWPVASWSGLDHGGGWKAMHYMARRFFEPVLVMVQREHGSYLITGINDRPDPVTIALHVVAVTLTGERIDLVEMDAALPTERALRIGHVDIDQVPDNAILIWIWTADDGITHRNHLVPDTYKALTLQPASLSMEVEQHNNRLAIALRAEKPALFVMAETSVPGHFSDNAFDILPGETITMFFTPDNPADLEEAKSNLVLRDLHASSHSEAKP
jgi:beta-mannosidase